MKSRLEYARQYITPNGERAAWRIFPLSAAEKQPLPGTHGYKDATTDPAQIERWWTLHPTSNIGVPTGVVNGIVVLDVDRGHTEGIDGDDTVKTLEAKLGELPDTVQALTPSGGYHLFFRYPAGRRIGKAVGTGETAGVDILGNGAYVVGVGSWCTPKQGGAPRPYQWEISSRPDEVPTAELPRKWADYLEDLTRSGTQITELPTWQDGTPIKTGSRNDTLFRLACKYQSQGTPDETIKSKLADINKQWCKPPLDARELEGLTRSALRYPKGQSFKATGLSAKKPLVTLQAAAEMLQESGYDIKLNVLTQEFEVTGVTQRGRLMTTEDLTTVFYDRLRACYNGVSRPLVTDYITFFGREHSFNPVVDLLDATQWDGTDRLPQLYALIGKKNLDELSKCLVHKWLLQGCALLLNDDRNPYGADGCLVFVGEQGAGKTSLLRHLALKPEFFCEGGRISSFDKDCQRRVLTHWISELGELESTFRSTSDDLKNLVTTAWDAYRLPYGRVDIKVPRRTNLAGTCNQTAARGGYLNDTTGNRRWWTVSFTAVNAPEDLTQLDALQLWAQIYRDVAAMSRDERACCFRLTRDEREQLNDRNGAFEKRLTAEDEILDILAIAETRGYLFTQMTVGEWKACWDELRPYSVQQLGRALTKVGIEADRDMSKRTRLLPIQENV